MTEIKTKEFLKLIKNNEIDLMLYGINDFKIRIYSKKSFVHFVNDEPNFVFDLKNQTIDNESAKELMILFKLSDSIIKKTYNYYCLQIFKQVECSVLTSTTLKGLEEMFLNGGSMICANPQIAYTQSIYAWKYNIFVDVNKLICEVIESKILKI